MNRKIFLSVALLFAGIAGGYAQSNMLNAKTPDQIGKKTEAQDSLDYDKPLPYGYVGDRDMLFSKKVWEVVDLDQRINFPLYFPTEDSNLGKDRRSLFTVLMNAMDEGKLTEIYEDSYFTTKVPKENVKDKFFFRELSPEGIDIKNQYPDKTVAELETEGIITAEHYNTSILQPSNVTKYKILGAWYFDKRQGELKYRILGICPMAPSALDLARSGADAEAVELFWVFYPAARDILHNAKAFNEKNSSMPITFDHLLNSRRFSGNIVKEENVYGDRLIEEYMRENSQMQLLEAERVKDKIRDFEQDMWNY